MGARAGFCRHRDARAYERALRPALPGSLSLHRRSPRLGPRRAAPGGLRRLLLVFMARSGGVDGAVGQSSLRVGVARSRAESEATCARDARADRAAGEVDAGGMMAR